MPADRYPGATWRPIAYRAEAGSFTGTPLGVILHVVVGNGSPYATFANAPAGSRRFSHFWISKNGVVEQYAETSRKSWAQAAGNGTYWSVETEGFPSEPLTAAQITAFGRLAAWLGVAPQIASTPGQRGIGTHYMGGAAWGGHTCPDPVAGAGPRSRQRGAIIAAMTPTTQRDWFDMATQADLVAAVKTALTDPTTARELSRLIITGANVCIDPLNPSGDRVTISYICEQALAQAAGARTAIANVGTGVVTQADLEAALRKVLGSVDGATP